MREERPIIALDFPAFDDVKNFLEHFPEDEKLFVKIGMEFFYAVGPEIVHYLKGLGHSIFLDLKLHDIPGIYIDVQFLADFHKWLSIVHMDHTELASHDLHAILRHHSVIIVIPDHSVQLRIARNLI